MDTTDPDITFDETASATIATTYDRLVAALVRSGAEGAAPARTCRRPDSARRRGPPLRLRHRRQRRRRQHVCRLQGETARAAAACRASRQRLGLRNRRHQHFRRASRALDIDLETLVIDWEEFKDIQLAFLRAGVPDCEIPERSRDRLVGAQRRQQQSRASLIWGYNTRTETHLPKAWSQGHFDWRYIKSVHRRFGTRPHPHVPAPDVHGQPAGCPFARHNLNLLDYVDYVKADADRVLQRDAGLAQLRRQASREHLHAVVPGLVSADAVRLRQTQDAPVEPDLLGSSHPGEGPRGAAPAAYGWSCSAPTPST